MSPVAARPVEVRLVAKCCAVVLMAALLAAPSPSRAQGIGAGPVPPRPVSLSSLDQTAVTWVPAGEAARTLLRSRAPELSHLLDLYGYDAAQLAASARELRCPLLRAGHAIALDDGHGSSLVLLFPAGADALLVPWAQPGAAADADAEQDPHNLARFNDLMAAEKLTVPAGTAAWVSLALLYLNLVGDTPHPLVASNLVAALGPKARGLAPLLLPLVVPETEGRAGVQFLDARGDADFAAWNFDFAANGEIRALERHDATAGGLLKGWSR